MKVVENISDLKEKKKKYSKHKKSYQRSKIDINDVIDAKVAIERDEILNDVVKNITRTSDGFFTLDVGKEKRTKSKKAKIRKTKEITEDTKPLLKCHKYLNGLPGAKAISKKKDPIKQRPCRIIRCAIKQNRTLSAPQLQKNAALRAKAVRKNKQAVSPFEAVIVKKDVWAKKVHIHDAFNDVAKTYVKDPLWHYEVSTKKNHKTAPEHHRQKPSGFKAFPKPMAGISYNPSMEDHKKLIKKAAETEEARVEKLKKDEKRYQPIFSKIEQKVSCDVLMKEMSQGIPMIDQDPDQEEDSNVQEEENNSSTGISGIKERKTAQSRKKLKTRRMQELKLARKKKQEQEEKKTDYIGKFKKEIEEREQLLKKRESIRQKKQKLSKLKTKRLSRYNYEAPAIAVALTADEMPGSIRSIKPIGNPLEDHYKSYQKRSVIEVRMRRTQGKGKKKKLINKRGLKEKVDELIKNIISKDEAAKLTT